MAAVEAYELLGVCLHSAGHVTCRGHLRNENTIWFLDNDNGKTQVRMVAVADQIILRDNAPLYNIFN